MRMCPSLLAALCALLVHAAGHALGALGAQRIPALAHSSVSKSLLGRCTRKSFKTDLDHFSRVCPATNTLSASSGRRRHVECAVLGFLQSPQSNARVNALSWLRGTATAPPHIRMPPDCDCWKRWWSRWGRAHDTTQNAKPSASGATSEQPHAPCHLLQGRNRRAPVIVGAERVASRAEQGPRWPAALRHALLRLRRQAQSGHK